MVLLWGSHTHKKFFWALNIPDSKVKQSTKNQKIVPIIPIILLITAVLFALTLAPKEAKIPVIVVPICVPKTMYIAAAGLVKTPAVPNATITDVDAEEL